ncbi:MAG TPA: HNH endonuclease signature motif containing protein, partial [Candidatus Dormibacteraeota bacterium]
LASGGGSQAQIQVTSSLETLLGLAGAPAAEMEHCLPVSSKTIERLGCDSSIARVLLNSESLVIDVGRSKRVVSEPGRRALTARDGHCRWPGCDRPASRSAAHHLIHWIHGGSSDLDNLILLCHRHHWMVHEGGWQITGDADWRVLIIPPVVTFGPPRGPD